MLWPISTLPVNTMPPSAAAGARVAQSLAQEGAGATSLTWIRLWPVSAPARAPSKAPGKTRPGWAVDAWGLHPVGLVGCTPIWPTPLGQRGDGARPPATHGGVSPWRSRGGGGKRASRPAPLAGPARGPARRPCPHG
jgi:hypothetical protein